MEKKEHTNLDIKTILAQLDANQLLELKETLNNLKFFGAHEIILGSFIRKYYSEKYGFYDGSGHSNVSRISYSEIFLYNSSTKRDALTEEDLDKTYNTHLENEGNMGEIYTFRPCKSDMFPMTLESEAILYHLPYQDLYTDYDRLKLLDFYNKWCAIKIKEKPFAVHYGESQKIILPLRQYKKENDGSIIALRPLQYFERR